VNLCDVTVIITTCNSAPRIATCLDKLSDFGEIVVVDSAGVSFCARVGPAPGGGGKRSG
jgi:hypothetical protein